MRSLTWPLFVVTATWAAAQGFECQPIGPFPTQCCNDCENAQSNATLLSGNVGTRVDATVTCGFPVAGAQYARIQASGPMSVAAGGPVARPIPLNVAEIRVPVPPGAPSVSFAFEFFNAQGPAAGGFNDGFAAAICGNSNDLAIAALVHRDVFSAYNSCIDVVSGGRETGAPGVDTVTHLFTSTELSAIVSSGGAYLSLACWNGGNNLVNSHACIDCITWGAMFQVPGAGTVDAWVENLTVPATDTFLIGAATPTNLRIRANPAVFSGGFHVFITQALRHNQLLNVPGIGGALLIDPTDAFGVLSIGALTPSSAPAPAAGPTFSVIVPTAALCGLGIVLQGYAEDAPVGSSGPSVRLLSRAYLAYVH